MRRYETKKTEDCNLLFRILWIYIIASGQVICDYLASEHEGLQKMEKLRKSIAQIVRITVIT